MILEFLAAHPPFHSITPGELADLAGSATTHTFAAGEVIVDYSSHVPDEVWMVRAGQVNLLPTNDNGVGDIPVDTVNVGGIFGFFPLLAAGSVQFVARAVEATILIRLSGDLMRPVFAKPAGLAYLAARAWDTLSDRTTGLDRSASRGPVGDLVRGDPVFTARDTTVRDAVCVMTDRRTSYILIPLEHGEYGIFTDRDLRTRVVAAGVSVDAPIHTVMSAPAYCVTADRLAATVLMDMLERGKRHIPVLSQNGAVMGVLEDVDLIAASTRQSFVLRRSIGLAADVDELQSVATGITELAVDLFRGGTDASATSGIVSVVIDSVVRRALELALTDSAVPRDAFAWMTLGSVARREAMPSSDVDSAVSWSDDAVDRGPDFRRLAGRVHTILDGCGLPADTNGAIASRPDFARSARDWTIATSGWLDDPLANRGIVMSSLLVDGRVVWGRQALHTVPAVYRSMARDHPNALRLQLLNALSDKVRLRSMRDVLSRRAGTFDLKAHALTPIVNLARWSGLTVGIGSASTVARLRAGAGNGLLSARDADILAEVFAHLQQLRMSHQIDQIEAGHRPGDIVSLAELSPLGRSLLGDGVREIAAVQRRVSHLAATLAG
ncbi:putative nucleotidyltransferase substrate binding domain-containing protein [Antrihabitans cavernicola]|uniref:CBS domain-containing protein n=1 Tax=Antrihabitans cavernicola TaxID=2495913 RepID=A0A5A7S6J7_9NOCA|nr:putative nucleotidyltransferase substrate binding domain-containing protein [Spelaeibacter cavernicola]KAA0021506.1 CBS domain-containing protein [Spelaeibacter cavernicola]